jgi:molecular chaperone DnaK
VFSTAADNQTQVEINVLQGERPMAADNKSLGRFILDGIPPAPRGVPQVEVTFDIDASGILSVKAKDKTSGKEQSIKITGSTGLSKEEVEQMTKDAEAHAAEDQEKKEKVEARNMADSLIFTAEKAVKDAGDKLPEDIKKDVEEKITALRAVLDSGSKDEIESKSKELSEAMQKIGTSYGGASDSAEASSDKQEPEIESEEKDGKTGEAESKDEAKEGEVVE